jgi:hypothetical protein
MNQRDRYVLQAVQSSAWLANFVRPNQQLIALEPYTYTGKIASIATGASGNTSIPIQADSDFVCIETTGSVYDNTAAGLVPSPYTTVQVTDSGTGKTFFSDYTLFALVFGIAGYPYYMPTPRIIAPNTSLLVNVVNLDPADTFTYYVAFQGARLYYAS